MRTIEKTLDFDKIKELLLEMAYTQKAKEEIKNLAPSLSEIEVRAKLRETAEAKAIIEKVGNPPFTAMEGMKEYLMTARMGGCLSAEQLEKISIMLTAIRRLKEFLKKSKLYEFSLTYYEENLEPLEEIKEKLDLKIRFGRVEDSASKTLKSLRNKIEQSELKMREKAEIILRSNRQYLSDSFTTLRNGHICLPIKKEYKLKIAGSIIEKSATGNTLFLEPQQVGKLYEELQLLRIEEENEVQNILYTLTAMLADKIEIMKENEKTIEKLDFIFAKAKLSIKLNGIKPEINTERYIKIINGRHPLIEEEICVPLNFELGREKSGMIITGPNMGGKTVAMKTVALNCLMAQCGLHVTCKEADICMNAEILCDIGDGQDISENLSTFSAHITNTLDILKRVNQESFVVMDELGSGTDPTEGMGIAIAILEELKESGALYLVTTHYPEVKVYAEKEITVINARMAFDKESLKPLYQLEVGKAGESCAFYIAGKLGMPSNMLRRAALAAYGTEKIDFLKNQENNKLEKETGRKIQKKKQIKNKQTEAKSYQIGDSILILPEKKIGIVCKTANEKGVLQVQLPNKKIWINHKRIKLQVAAKELYPEDYDFSIIFETTEQRKAKHQMERKYTGDLEIEYKEDNL